MQSFVQFNSPRAFFMSTTILIVGLLAVSSLRHSAAYVQIFDVVILSFALLLLAWSIVLWWYRIKGTKEGGFVTRRLRHFLLLVIGAPFLYIFLVVGEDLGARRLPIYNNALNLTASSGVMARMLGSSTTTGWPIHLAAEVSSDTGNAELSIPITGSTNNAELHVDGVKDNGVWSIKDLYLVEGGTNTQTPIPVPPSLSPNPR